MITLKDLLRELRRRRVFRMTAIYIVAAWVVVQVASETFPAFNIPEGAIRYVWIAVLIGFPIAVLFSWQYDVTASGIRRTPATHESLTEVRSLTRVDYGILTALGLVMLATVFSVGQRLVEVQTEIARAPTTREIDPNSIAVLPLENLSRNPGDVYFAAGVHDALITSLSKVTALMVTSRTSTLRVNPELSVPEIGRQLGVAKLLEGSVLMDGDRVRIIVQLIDAASDLHMWADTYEREVADIIALQNEVARTIADVIEVRLTPREAVALAEATPVQPNIYRDYLKGMYQFRQETPEADRRGIEILEEVVRQDPTSALAHAGVAYGYASLAHSPFPEDAYPKAKSAADIALQLDPELAEAHMAVGTYRFYYERDFEGAEKALTRAIKLNPSLAEAHYHLGWLYEMFGPAREEEHWPRASAPVSWTRCPRSWLLGWRTNTMTRAGTRRPCAWPGMRSGWTQIFRSAGSRWVRPMLSWANLTRPSTRMATLRTTRTGHGLSGRPMRLQAWKTRRARSQLTWSSIPEQSSPSHRSICK